MIFGNKLFSENKKNHPFVMGGLYE